MNYWFKININMTIIVTKTDLNIISKTIMNRELSVCEGLTFTKEKQSADYENVVTMFCTLLLILSLP